MTGADGNIENYAMKLCNIAQLWGVVLFFSVDGG